MKNTIKKIYDQEPNYWKIKTLITLVVVAAVTWSSSAVNFNISSNGNVIAVNIVKGIFSPSMDMILNFSSQGLPYLLLETICIALLGTIVGAFFSIPLAFLAAPNVVNKYIAFVFRMAIMMIRTIPSFVYGLMFIRVTGPGPFAGLMTFSLTSIGMLTKLFIESIEDLDQGIIESLDASGCNTFEKIRYGIMPQLTPSFISTSIYRFDLNLKDAPILGLVGAGGIGAPLSFAMSSYRWNEVGSILLGLVILVLLIEYLSTKIRTKLARG